MIKKHELKQENEIYKSTIKVLQNDLKIFKDQNERYRKQNSMINMHYINE